MKTLKSLGLMARSVLSPFANFWRSITAPAPYALGAIPGPYPAINTTTAAALIAADQAAQEVLWSKRTIAGADLCYQDAPLNEFAMARVEPGEKPSDRDLQKFIVSVTDAQAMHGQVVNITTRAGIAGPGVAGEGECTGNELTQQLGTFSFRIGFFWYGSAFTMMARDQTMLGIMNDKYISDGFRALHAKKRNDDHLMRMIAWANMTTIVSGGVSVTNSVGYRNNLLPEGVVNVASLKSANVVDTTLISNVGTYQPRLGGIPMDTVMDSGASVGQAFTYLDTDIALQGLQTEPAYLQGLSFGAERGKDNPIFAGGLQKWNKHALYQWIMKDHANKGSIGSPLNARALLGAAVTGVNTSTVLQGGGFVYNSGDWPIRNYFEFFAGAYYQFHNGDTIAQNTSVFPTGFSSFYIVVINPTPNAQGHYWRVYGYTTVGSTSTTADTIAISNASIILGLPGEILSGDTGGLQHPQGALIVQCNPLGTPYGYGFMLGAQGMVCGSGSINGSVVNPLMGQRTVEIRNAGMAIALGARGVWGNNVVQRAGDGSAPGFVMTTHALTINGAPVVV